MRRPRIRFSILALMTVVAIVALMLSLPGILDRRRSAFVKLERFHAEEAGDFGLDSVGMGFYRFRLRPPPLTEADVQMNIVIERKNRQRIDRGVYHARMQDKYRQAAVYPWLPVVFDPPEPE